MDRITKQQTRKEMDMGIANAARGVVFRSLIKSVKEHGKDSPETKKIEEEMDKLTSIFEKMRRSDRKAIHYTRTELKKFVEENTPRIDLKDVKLVAFDRDNGPDRTSPILLPRGFAKPHP
ncbi:MAG: hypothetical protein PHS57_04160 [Alphaproteobacteria bacterium]|nr:hypothetical protein [Alphaproteobacteria bacterium]